MENTLRFACRKPTRLVNYDYSRCNYYFITVCTHEKKCIFGTIGKLSPLGEVADRELASMDSYYKGIHVEKYVVMPNHVHAIISIENLNTENRNTTLSSIVGSYKSGVSRKIRMYDPDMIVWQRSFHDHIIRGQPDYDKIWEYIQNNPQKWEDDCFYPNERKP